MTVRQKSSTKLITAVLLTALLGLGIAPVEAFGEPVYRKVGESNGLVIEVPEKTQDTGNLGPGDTKQSHIRLTNSNQRSVTVYMRTEIVEESTLYGGKLAEAFRLKIMDGSGTVYDGTFQEAHDKGNISLGRMTPNAEKTLYFYADLPGRETGNEYQGSSMKVQWVFTTQVGGGGGGGGGDEGGRRGGGGGERKRSSLKSRTCSNRLKSPLPLIMNRRLCQRPAKPHLFPSTLQGPAPLCWGQA